MYSLPFFHISGENAILKNILDESKQEIYLVHAETLEIIFLNKTAITNLGSQLTGLPFNVSRLGDDYQLRSFKGLIFPLMNGSQDEIILLAHHKNSEGKLYPVEVRIIRNTIQGLDYLILTAENNSEKLNLEKELKHKNEAYKKLSFELDKFVYSASHDLLAPISTLKGLLNLVEKENIKLSENKNPDYQGMMNKTVNKLERYIYDMIDFSKNMRQDVASDSINFKNMVAVVMDNQRFTAGFDKLNINVEIIQEDEFYSDEIRLQMLLNNLVSNAIKYQQPNCRNPFLHINIAAEAKRVTICLKDNGIGIGKESIDRVFDMFYRASSSSYGSGLGLYIAKEVVKKLKGKIHVASTVGEGSEFLLEIPNKSERPCVNKNVKQKKPFKTAL